jgi:thioredoxin
MFSLIGAVLVGGGLGAALGRFGHCSTGSCPLTANWKRGAAYGAVLGLLFDLSSSGSRGPYPAPKNLTPIAEGQFDTEVTQADEPVVLDFFAPWCGPCKALAPGLDALAKEYAGKVKFVQVNVDDAQALAARFDVQGVPTLLFFRNGKVVDSVSGLVSTEMLRKRLERLVTLAAGRNLTPALAEARVD